MAVLQFNIIESFLLSSLLFNWQVRLRKTPHLFCKHGMSGIPQNYGFETGFTDSNQYVLRFSSPLMGRSSVRLTNLKSGQFSRCNAVVWLAWIFIEAPEDSIFDAVSTVSPKRR